MGWEGVNCGLRISRKPVSTKDARLDDVAAEDGAGPASLLEASLSLSLLDCGANDLRLAKLVLEPVRSLRDVVNCVRDPSNDWRLDESEVREPLSRALVGAVVGVALPEPPLLGASAPPAGVTTRSCVGLTNMPQFSSH